MRVSALSSAGPGTKRTLGRELSARVGDDDWVRAWDTPIATALSKLTEVAAGRGPVAWSCPRAGGAIPASDEAPQQMPEPSTMLESAPMDNGIGLRVRALVIVLLGGCQPEIGDDCMLSTDCSQQGDRQCDTTQPGGYCTIFNCEPGGCPDEAICVAFSGAPPSAEVCQELAGSVLKRRTFCLRTCEGGRDCRSGYECADFGEADNPWGAVIVETAKASRVCAPPASASAVDTDMGVCEPVAFASDAGTAIDFPLGGAGGSDDGGAAGNWTGGGAAGDPTLARAGSPSP